MSTYITKRANELGIKVVDATTPLIVGVAQKDINGAKRKDSKVCGFARACERQFPIEAAFFFKSTAWLEYKDKIVRYHLPPSMQKEIVAFDRNKTMEPGVYRLSAVRPTGTLKAKEARRAKEKAAGVKNHLGTGKIKRTKMFRHQTTNIRSTFDPSYRAAK